MKDITDTVNDVCTTLTVAMLPNGLQFDRAVSRTVGWTACPVEIRAHHHKDVYTDINKPCDSIKELFFTSRRLYFNTYTF